MENQTPSNPQEPQKVTRNIRYDRILAVIVVLILLVVILVKCVSSCGSDDTEVATTDEETTEETTEQETTETTESKYAGAIYLSPSNQADHEFATGDTNESEVCQEIAQKTADLLEACGLTVFVAGEDDTAQTKVQVGDYDLAAYVGIQTNEGTGSGTSCFYNGSGDLAPESLSLAESIYDEVAALTERDDNGLIDASDSTSDDYEYEMAMNNSPCALIEIEYHDTETIAQWILDNEDSIADAIASGICEYLGVSYTTTTTVGTVSEVSDEDSDTSDTDVDVSADESSEDTSSDADEEE